MHGQIKQEIISFTSQLIIRYGIRAVRMDDLAREMNISKRTIYQLFTTKDELIYACVNNYLYNLGQRFSLSKNTQKDTLEKLLELSKIYIDDLYTINSALWSEISQTYTYKKIYVAYNACCYKEFKEVIIESQKDGYIFEYINIKTFVTLFLSLLYNARLNRHSYNAVEISAHLLIRGMTTYKGSDRLGEFIDCKHRTDFELGIFQ